MRLLRLSLLAGNLPLMHLSRESLLSGIVNVPLMQLVASVATLLFTSASVIHLVERIHWHKALYFVTTTMTTVGYGDVVMQTDLGEVGRRDTADTELDVTTAHESTLVSCPLESCPSGTSFSSSVGE